MKITRRDFLRYCVSSAVTMSLNLYDLVDLEDVLANQQGPKVLWLQGSGGTSQSKRGQGGKCRNRGKYHQYCRLPTPSGLDCLGGGPAFDWAKYPFGWEWKADPIF